MTTARSDNAEFGPWLTNVNAPGYTTDELWRLNQKVFRYLRKRKFDSNNPDFNLIRAACDDVLAHAKPPANHPTKQKA